MFALFLHVYVSFMSEYIHAYHTYNSVYTLQMETEEQSSSESNVKENGESEKNEKSPEEETVLAPAVKHLEENELFSQYYLV